MIKLSEYHRIVILTGAGASAHLGLPTFEELYEDEEVMNTMHIDVLETNPEKVWKMLGPIRKKVFAIRGIENHWVSIYNTHFKRLPAGSWTTVTTNVDGVKPFVMGPEPIEFHGNIMHTKCLNIGCGFRIEFDEKTYEDDVPICPICGHPLRPDVTLYGEYIAPKPNYEAKQAMKGCDLFIAVGTSGRSGTLANFMLAALLENSTTVLINKTPVDDIEFDHVFLGDAYEQINRRLSY